MPVKSQRRSILRRLGQRMQLMELCASKDKLRTSIRTFGKTNTKSTLTSSQACLNWSLCRKSFQFRIPNDYLETTTGRSPRVTWTSLRRNLRISGKLNTKIWRRTWKARWTKCWCRLMKVSKRSTSNVHWQITRLSCPPRTKTTVFSKQILLGTCI